MAKQLTTASIAAPGFFGLNTQESSVTLAEGFALVADNCVIDKYGRLGSRKGWEYQTDPVAFAGVQLSGGHEFIDIDGTRYIGVWSNNSFYIVNGDQLNSVTYLGSNVITTDGWQAATLNDAAYLFHRNYEPIYFNPSTGQLDDVVNVGHGAVPKGNTVLSAYGRLWTADTLTNKTTVYWSTLLNGANFASGSAGSIDLSSVLVNGNDEIVALGAQAGRLIIFCKDNIVIYADTDADTALNPATMKLVEVIHGIGCIARDSVQNTGNDILFLAEDGVRSLGRLIQEKSQPMRDISKNVRDELVFDVTSSDLSTIKSVYYPKEAMYLLQIPKYQRIYCFDTRSYLQDGSARVTRWDGQTQTNMFIANEELFFTQTNGVATYSGYFDNNEPYTLRYYTNYMDFGDSTTMKYMKRLACTVVGGQAQYIVFKAGYDYSGAYFSFNTSLTPILITEYGIGEYNESTSEYSTGQLSENLRVPIGGGGNILQAGFEASINGFPLSIQKLDLYVKQGRIY